jgi:hypothetical protein
MRLRLPLLQPLQLLSAHLLNSVRIDSRPPQVAGGPGSAIANRSELRICRESAQARYRPAVPSIGRSVARQLPAFLSSGYYKSQRQILLKLS